LLNILLCFPSLDMFFSFSFWLLPNKIVLIPFSHVKHTRANWDWYFILFFWDDNIFWDKKMINHDLSTYLASNLYCTRKTSPKSLFNVSK